MKGTLYCKLIYLKLKSYPILIVILVLCLLKGIYEWYKTNANEIRNDLIVDAYWKKESLIDLSKIDNNNDKKNRNDLKIAIATVAFYSDSQINHEIYMNQVYYSKYHNYDYYCLRYPFSGQNYSNLKLHTFWKPLLIDSLLHFKNISFDNRDIKNIETWNNNINKNKNKNNANYDYVFWIDFDALFMNYSISIESLIFNEFEKIHSRYNRYNKNNNINARFDLLMACETKFSYNAGIMIWRFINSKVKYQLAF